MIRNVPFDLLGRRANRYLVLVFIALACMSGRDSHSATHQGMGPLSQIVFTGLVQGWTGTLSEGGYWLENTAGDPNDIRYFYTAPVPRPRAGRTVGVDVLTAGMHPEGRAGLLYGYRESPRFYYLIMVSGSGDVEVFRRDDGGFDRLLSSSLSGTTRESVRIEVQEKGRELTILANGKVVSTLGNDQIGSGLVGIAAFGTGRFGFTNYNEVPSPKDSAPPRSALDDRPSRAANQPSKMDQLEYIEYLDPQLGIAQLRAPFPKGWRYDDNPNDQLLLIGPHGTECYQTSSGQFLYSDDPSARQSAQMGGARVAPFMPLSRYVEQQFAPYMGQRGYKLTRQFPLPKVIHFMEKVAAGMPQGLSKKQFDALGAEWERNDGSRAYTQLTQTLLVPQSNQQQPFISWEVSALELYAARDQFESAKDALIHASENTELNPRWQIAKNQDLLAKIRASDQYWDERTRESHMQHIGRMNAILARSEANSSVAKINSDILDISHAGYLKRSDMVSAGQARSVNLISGQSVITNPNTGEFYQVDSGSNHYWVNAEGKYFRTDNSLYDPRTDNQISNQQWERFEVVQ